MKSALSKLITFAAAITCLATSAHADTIVQWGVAGGASDIVDGQQNMSATTTYTPGTAINPAVGSNYYPNNTGRTPVFNGAVGASSVDVIRGFNPDPIAFGLNTGGDATVNKFVYVFESGNFLDVGGPYALDSITFEAGLYSNGAGAGDSSVYRFVLQDAGNDFHISQEFDLDDSISGQTSGKSYTSLAGELSWFDYTPFVSGVDTIGSSSTPSLANFTGVGLYGAVADPTDNWAQMQTRFFQVQTQSIPEPSVLALLIIGAAMLSGMRYGCIPALFPKRHR